MAGSREYQRKEKFAKQDYLDGLKRTSEARKGEGDEDKPTGLTEALLIDMILARAAVEELGQEGDEALRNRCMRNLRPDDKEDWMKISPEQLDTMLIQKQKEFEDYDKTSPNAQKKKRQKREGNGAKKDEETLREFEGLVNNMKSFVNTVSAYEGAEFPKESTGKGEDMFAMDIDPDKFIRIMKNTLAPDEDDGDDGDDGSMSEEDDFYSLSEDDEEEGEEDQTMTELMERMDRELYTTKIGQDFEKQPDLSELPAKGKEKEEDDSFRPVDIDLNLMRNILESLDAQHGLPGPLSNILNEMQNNKGK